MARMSLLHRATVAEVPRYLWKEKKIVPLNVKILREDQNSGAVFQKEVKENVQ